MRRWSRSDPIIIESGEGFELIDDHGRRYIDGFSSLWCNLHGHRVRQIDNAISEQLGKIAHSTLLGLASIPSIELARRLVQVAPAGLTRVFFSDSGATAVEVALKLAFQYFHNTGRKARRFIALKEGYHGDTIGAVSVGGVETFHALFKPLLFETTFVDCPNSFYHPAGGGSAPVVLSQVEAAIDAGDCCAVIIEPLIQAAGGMLTHPTGFLSALRKLTRDRGVLLIADEVATGFCRTGSMFACDRENVCPDIMCLGKGLTGGYLPVAATLASEELYGAFYRDGPAGTFFHGHTFTGNALGCAAAVASMDLIESSGLVASLDAKCALLEQRLARLANHPNIADIRRCGLMVGIDFMMDPAARAPFDPSLRIGEQICRRATDMGLMIRPLDDIVVLMPAPAMDLDTMTRMMDILEAAIHDQLPR